MRNICIVLACVILYGCSTEITGGQAKHETMNRNVKGGTDTSLTGMGRVEITPDGITVTFDRNSKSTTQPTTQESGEIIATTQPSGKTNTGQNISVGGADEGELGGMSLKSVEAKFKNAWWLGLLLMAASVPFFYPLRNTKLVGGILFITGIVTCLYPLAVVIGGCLLLAALVYSTFKSHFDFASLQADTKDIVTSVGNAIQQLDPTTQVEVESKIGRNMDKKTKRRVGNLKNAQ